MPCEGERSVALCQTSPMVRSTRPIFPMDTHRQCGQTMQDRWGLEIKTGASGSRYMTADGGIIPTRAHSRLGWRCVVHHLRSSTGRNEHARISCALAHTTRKRVHMGSHMAPRGSRWLTGGSHWRLTLAHIGSHWLTFGSHWLTLAHIGSHLAHIGSHWLTVCSHWLTLAHNLLTHHDHG
jgi:hypothetical protein